MNKIDIPYQYISIEGNIGAGKTTFCKMMTDEYNCELILEQFANNPFLPFFYKDPERYAFTVELFFMTERHKQLQKTLLNPSLFSPFKLADYSFIKTLLFARKNLGEEEYRLFTQLYNTLKQSFPDPDLLVYFHRDVNILQKNIAKRDRDYEKDITNDYLLKIQNSYFEYFRNIVSYPVLIIDLKEIDFISNPKQYDEIKKLLAKKYSPGIHRYSLWVD